MESENIHLNDWWRILMGEVPGFFLLEVILRTAFLFLVLLISMRLLGKRMAGQLNKSEMISLTTLAAAIGVPLQAPDRGLIPPLIIAGIVIGVGHWISKWSYANRKFESAFQGKIGILVEDSVLQISQMSKIKITRERLFAQLRSKGIIHLGQVKRVYFEAGGFFSVTVNKEPAAGLKIIPLWDKEFHSELKTTPEIEVCTYCGKSKEQHEKRCRNCENSTWEAACLNGLTL
jgi:uncharacterized membrane protein YcaP (DUF421 family)